MPASFLPDVTAFVRSQAYRAHGFTEYAVPVLAPKELKTEIGRAHV
jgi:hypothetical protein